MIKFKCNVEKYLLVIFGFLILTCNSSFAGPFDTIKVGEWQEIPNTKLRNVLPPAPANYIGDPANIIKAWNSGAFDTTNNRLLIFGGGHNDYGGNEVYAFDINTLKWSIVAQQSASIPTANSTNNCVATYADGNPVSRHTYDALEYLPAQDALWMHGGSRYCGPGSGGNDTWHYQLFTNKWVRQANLPVASTLEMVSAYDKNTGHIYLTGPMGSLDLYEFSPESNTWKVAASGSIADGMTGAFDPKRKIFIAIGNDYYGNQRVYAYDLSQPNPVRATWSTHGDTEVLNKRYPGIDYDPVTDKIVAWIGGSAVYTLDMDTKAWKKINTTGMVVPDTPPSQGIYNRWRYIPSKNAFIVVNGIDQNVFIYKLSDGTGDYLSPSSSTGLTVD